MYINFLSGSSKLASQPSASCSVYDGVNPGGNGSGVRRGAGGEWNLPRLPHSPAQNPRGSATGTYSRDRPQAPGRRHSGPGHGECCPGSP